MKIKIEKIEFTPKTIEVDIEVPYFAWWDYKKEEIIKIVPKHRTGLHGIPELSHLHCLIISNPWSGTKSIATHRIGLNNKNEFDNELNKFLIDYSDITTEAEFEKFLNQTLIDILGDTK